MLTRCKRAMDICTSRAFISGAAASTLIGQLATALGPQAWVNEEARRLVSPGVIESPRPNTHLTAHPLPTFTNVADKQIQGDHAPASSPTLPPNRSSPSRSRRRNTSKLTVA
ncbi:hypothetical protein EDD16DRAFT_1546286 [Pisolithus croceorrhizus]|nr:hypothetical protein EDD16DRAFT_1546286 [Pisolithus croceorrhizus]